MGSFNKILHNKNFLILAVTTLCSVLVLTMAVNNCNFIISTTETDFSDSIDLQPLAGATLTIDTNGTVHGYHSGDTVQINALFEYLNGTPIQNGNISYEIDDPSGSPIFIDLGLTDANGQNSTTYTLNPSASEGTYTVYVVGDKNNGQFNDTAQTIFYVDNTPPNLTYTNPSVNGTDITISPNIWINGTAFGTISNVSRVLINDTRFGIGITGVPQVDPSGTSGGNFAFRNNTVLGSGTYAVKVTVTDDAGNTNSSVIWFTLSYVDTNPPQASNPRPPNGGYGPDGVTIMVDLTDDISGINASTIVLTVEGVVRSHSWNGTTVSWTAGSGLFANGQVIDVSVDASDNAGNTMATYSWSFTMDLVAPVASNPDPANGGYTSDTTPTIVVALSDALSGVDGSSITLRVEGSGVSHTFNGTHVYYTPSVPFSDGQVINVDLDASDNVGNAMATYSWSFTIDTSAPTASNENPANGAYTSDSTPTITVMLSDSGSGIDSSSIQMKVESTSVSYTWNGTHVSYTPSSAFANGQVVDVTVDALDNVGNAMATYSWSFTVDTAPPVASNPSPANGGYTNDPTPTIVIALSDALSGIDSSSIVMTVESSVVGHTFNGTHVFYTPSTAFANGQVIDVTLDASDNVGNAMATYSWSFTIDTAAPVASNPDPANGAYTNDATPTITLALSDALSDVDASSIVMQVESSVVLHTWNGTHVSYTPSSAFSNGQVINVSVDASDNAGNVMATYSWSFTIDTAAPVASNPSPSDGSYTNDTTPIIVVALSDALSGVNASSIILRVESSVVLHTWNGTHVSYTPSTAFADGQVVNVDLNASDNAGNAMATYSWSFTIDTSPPTASNENPANGAYTSDSTPTITVRLTDAGSGVDSSSIQMRVESLLVSHNWNGTHVSYTPSSAFSNGQVIDVSVDASDNLGNAMATYSWSFTIDTAPPVASNPSPPNGGYTSDTTPTIIIALSDALSGVDSSSIAMTVEGSTVIHTWNDTHVSYTPSTGFTNGQVIDITLNASDNVGNAMATYSWSFTIDTAPPVASNPSPSNGGYTNDATPTIVVALSDALSGVNSSSITLTVESSVVSHNWNGTHVIYTPGSAFADGQVINVDLDASDNAGNAMATYSWSFTIDISAPSASNEKPVNNGYTNDSTPTITVALSDSLSGIDSSTITMTVEGSTVSYSWNGTHVSYTPSSAFANGQVVNVAVNVSDNAGNTMPIYSWSFTVDIVPPNASNESPANQSTTSDTQPTISVYLSDALSGVDASTIIFIVNGTNIPSANYTYNALSGLLSYTPTSPYSEGKIDVAVRVRDNAGNLMPFYNWTFNITIGRPYCYNPIPADGAYVGVNNPVINVTIDGANSINPSTIIFKVEGSVVSFTWSNWTGNALNLSYQGSGYVDGQVINCEIENASDYSGNWMLTPYVWSFTVDLSAPQASNPSPQDGAYTSDATPTITIDLSDAYSGINSSTIVLTVEGSAVTHSWDGSTVSYTPSTPFANGQVINVSLDASDNVGNAMATYSWAFTIDTAPPVASNPSPANGAYVSNTQPTITVDLSDALSGVDASTISMTVEGSAVVHSWDGSTVSYTPSTPFADGQVVDVTIDASDNVGNAMATYSWSFTIDISPPVASNEKPANNTYTSNTQPTIIVALSDAISDVDPSSIVLRVESSVVPHNWNGTHVSYTPGTAFANGQVVDVSLDASDNVGNAMASYVWSFTVDTAPPVASNPSPANGAYVSNTQPTITVDLSDALSGVDASSISMTVEGSAVAHSWDGSTVSYTPSTPFADGQVVDVTINASDNVGNAMVTYSWSFTIDVSPPVASNEKPANNTYTSNTQPTIIVALSDAISDVDPSSIVLRVESSIVGHTWNGTHVSYTPGTAFANGQVVDVSLDASDNVGNAMASYVWSFTVDTAPPVASNPSPTDGSYTNDATPTIIIALSDALSDVDASSIVLNVEGSVVGHTWNGTHVSYTPSTAFANGQVINVSLDASDNVGNAMATYSWAFTIDTAPPVASNPSPANGAYVSNTQPTITVDLSDALSGVDASTISMTVEGSAIVYSWDGSTVSYTPSTPFADGQVVDVTIDASDNVGNAMATYSWSFTIDISPPVASNEKPANNTYTSNTQPTIIVALSDAISDVDPSSIVLRVESSVVPHNWNGTHVSYTPSTPFANGQVVDVSLDASDNVGNAMASYVWSFTVDTAPPVASNPSPANGSYIANTTPTITVTLVDALSGVDPLTIQMRVEGILVSHSYIGNTVSWNASTPYSDGQVINVSLHASDNLGNAMSTYEWYFTIDISPPVASNEEPTGTISESRPLIRVKLEDLYSGINFTATQMLLNGTSVAYGYDGENLTYTPLSPLPNGVHNVTIVSSDNAGNSMVPYQWTFQVLVVAPYAHHPSPGNNTYTNDATPMVIVYLSAYWGVDSTTIRLWLNGSLVAHTWTSINATTGRVRYIVPAPGYNHGDIINATVQCNDTMGNQMEPYTWFFTIDLVAPSGSNEAPSNGAYTNDATPTITLDISDALSGVNGSSIVMQVNSVPVTYTWDGSTVSYTPSTPFTDGTVVSVSVDASDNAGNAMATYSWSFTVDLSSPSASNPSPADSSYVNIATPTISVDLSDALSGVNGASIVMRVEDSAVSHIWDGSTVSYTPSTPFSDGQVVNVDVDASDNAGNAMATYSWSFTVDLTPPTINIVVNNTYTNWTSFYITINVTTSEDLSTLSVNVTNPNSVITSVAMSEITVNLWQGQYEVKINGTYQISAVGYDNAGNSGTDTAQFVAIITDLTPPNFISMISNPAGLIYNETARPSDWSTYPECAGLGVNVTALFNETEGAYPIVEVIIYYKLSTTGVWTTAQMSMTGNSSTGGGLYRLYGFSYVMPALENGTIVSISIYARDGANNTYTLNASGHNLEYTVLGNWIVSYNILELLPDGLLYGTNFNIVVTSSMRNSSYLLMLNVRIHDPRKVILEPQISSNYTLYNNTMSLVGGNYRWTYPYSENITYGTMIYVQFWILNNDTGQPTPYTYGGSTYLMNGPFIFVSNVIDNVVPSINTTVELSTTNPTPDDDIELVFEMIPEGVGSAPIEYLIVYYRVNGGPYAALTPIEYKGKYAVVIPKQDAGATIEFYIEIKDEAGNVFKSSVYQINVQLEDITTEFVIALIFIAIFAGVILTIMQNKSKVKKATGKDRYKYIKKKVGGK